MPPGVDRLYGAARDGTCANGLSGRSPSTRYECTIWVFSARLATSMLMPMLPPRLPIRLRIAVPWVRIWRGSVDSARMLSGTWVQPRPNPCSSPEMMTGTIPICSENWLICHIDSAVNRTAAVERLPRGATGDPCPAQSPDRRDLQTQAQPPRPAPLGPGLPRLARHPGMESPAQAPHRRKAPVRIPRAHPVRLRLKRHP